MFRVGHKGIVIAVAVQVPQGHTITGQGAQPLAAVGKPTRTVVQPDAVAPHAGDKGIQVAVCVQVG